jgi:hypothetical protein
MKSNYRPGAVTGKAFEDKIDSWADAAGIPYKSDDTISSGGRRRKDLKCDRCYLINGKEVYVELKTTTEKASMDFSLYNDGKQHKIKYYQIHQMDYIIMCYRPNEPLLISKKGFILWACSVDKKSISYKDALKIGKRINDMEWLYEC